MAWPASGMCIHCVLALLLLLLLGCKGDPWAGVHSLRYVLTIQKSLSGQWSCEIQGCLEKMLFLSYSSSDDRFSPLGHLGERISATETWKKQADTLKDAQNLFYQKVLDLQQKYDTIPEPLTLQVTLYCQWKGSGHAHGSWSFDFNGQMFHFAPGNRKWTQGHPGSSWMKEWEDDSDMSEFLYKTSLGDCKNWLQEFLLYLEETWKPTAPPVTSPDVSQPENTAIMPEARVLLTLLTCFLLPIL